MADNGVFTLDQLKALGQTGDAKTDWLNQNKGRSAGLILGGGNAVIPPGIPGGYYRIPGQDQAFFYDPKTGQAPQELVDYFNSPDFTKDPITGVPHALINGGDTGDFFRSTDASQDPKNIDTMNKIIAEHNAGASYQDAQDKILGIGKYQTGITGSDGKTYAMGDPRALVQNTGYVDRGAATPGAFDRLTKSSGKTEAELNGILKLPGDRNWNDGSIWKSLRDSVAQNAVNSTSSYEGLQKIRSDRGLDPNTGISDAEKARIWETYNRIQDPAQKAAYIKYQDPGNLVPQLLDARKAARASEDQAYLNQAPETRLAPASMYGVETPDKTALLKLTISPQLHTDEATGREVAFSAPTNVEYLAPKKDKLTRDMTRVGGGIMGAVVGFATGGLPGAAIGAYFGAGGPTSSFSFKNPGNAAKFHGNNGHLMDLKQVATAFAFAYATGGGVWGQGFNGVGASSARGFVAGSGSANGFLGNTMSYGRQAMSYANKAGYYGNIAGPGISGRR